jgi:hypothetical protein
MPVNSVEDVLRGAYADLAAAVRQDDVGAEAPAAGRPVRWHSAARSANRRLVPLAAAAIVLVVVITAGFVARAVQTGSRRPPAAAAGGPYGMVITPNGKTIYVASARGQVTPIDVAARKTGRPFRVGGQPRAMLMTPDGRTGYLLEPPYGVAVVSFTTNTRLGFIKVPYAESFALTPDGRTLYVVKRHRLSGHPDQHGDKRTAPADHDQRGLCPAVSCYGAGWQDPLRRQPAQDA